MGTGEYLGFVSAVSQAYKQLFPLLTNDEKVLTREFSLALQARANNLDLRDPHKLTAADDAIKKLADRGEQLFHLPFRNLRPTLVQFEEIGKLVESEFKIREIEYEVEEEIRTYLNKIASLKDEQKVLMNMARGAGLCILEEEAVVKKLLKLNRTYKAVGSLAEDIFEGPVGNRGVSFAHYSHAYLSALSLCLIIGLPLYQLSQGEQTSKVTDHLTHGAIMSCLPFSFGLAIQGIEWMFR